MHAALSMPGRDRRLASTRAAARFIQQRHLDRWNKALIEGHDAIDHVDPHS
jgi:hypothetical protein